MVTTGKLSEWEELATRKFQFEKVTPNLTLQQHIDYQQVTGMCGYFFLIYVGLSIALCFPRYLIFDSPLTALFRRIGRSVLRVAHWLKSEICTRVRICLKGEKAKDSTKSDAS